MLTDAGPLVALIDRGERYHAQCVAALASLALPLLTTWPAFTEAMYLLARGGWPAQELLWRLVRRGDLELATLDGTGLERTAALMAQYQNVPMDLADATLIALTEQQGLTRIFTLDAHFQIYRPDGHRRLTIMPQPGRRSRTSSGFGPV